MDACRSFGVFCALAPLGTNGAGAHDVEMLLANTATKLFFRSTDGMGQRYVKDLCPTTPGRPRVTDVRPLSTLRPGECYAVLADGRMERRRLSPFPGAAPARIRACAIGLAIAWSAVISSASNSSNGSPLSGRLPNTTVPDAVGGVAASARRGE